MTNNQIQYWKLQEDKRSNRAVEAETTRHNVVSEGEIQRHNKITEGEEQRHNLMDEFERNRTNVENERLKHEDNNIKWLRYEYEHADRKDKLAEENRTNLAREAEEQRSNLAREAEERRNNTFNNILGVFNTASNIGGTVVKAIGTLG